MAYVLICLILIVNLTVGIFGNYAGYTVDGVAHGATVTSEAISEDEPIIEFHADWNNLIEINLDEIPVVGDALVWTGDTMKFLVDMTAFNIDGVPYFLSAVFIFMNMILVFIIVRMVRGVA